MPADSETRREILIVEDDDAIARGLELNLKLEGYTPHRVEDGDQVLDALAAIDPALLLLDISLPTKNGLEVLREMRQAGIDVPVVVLSARQYEADKVAALKLGADDYVTKPFGVAELLARIDAVLRRVETTPAVKPETQPQGAIAFGEIQVDRESRQVTLRGADVALTHLEFELLLFLLSHPGKVFSREELLRRVWGVQHKGSPRTVDNFVGQLRAKLESDPNQPHWIRTVRGSGYRFESQAAED